MKCIPCAGVRSPSLPYSKCPCPGRDERPGAGDLALWWTISSIGEHASRKACATLIEARVGRANKPSPVQQRSGRYDKVSKI